MSSIGTGYDLSPTTYSPDGKVFQVDYAQKAVDNGGTTVGIRCKDGVVLGVEKAVLSKMLCEGSTRRVFPVDRHAGVATTGMTADGRMIANRCKSECNNYRKLMGERIPGVALCDRVAQFLHLFTLYWFVRPMGAAALLAVCDKDGPQLYCLETSGQAHRYFGCAIGKGRQAARTEIERLNLSELSARDAVKSIAKMLHSVREEREKGFELELSWACEETGYTFQRVPEDLHKAADEEARRAVEEEEMRD